MTREFIDSREAFDLQAQLEYEAAQTEQEAKLDEDYEEWLDKLEGDDLDMISADEIDWSALYGDDDTNDYYDEY